MTYLTEKMRREEAGLPPPCMEYSSSSPTLTIYFSDVRITPSLTRNSNGSTGSLVGSPPGNDDQRRGGTPVRDCGLHRLQLVLTGAVT